MTGVGGAVFDKLEELISFLDFINSLAEEFISTKEIGNIPTFPLSLPSAQLSSTFLISKIISFLAKEMQSFSSTSVTRKSYNALHCGVGTKREDALGGICTQLAERKPWFPFISPGYQFWSIGFLIKIVSPFWNDKSL